MSRQEESNIRSLDLFDGLLIFTTVTDEEEERFICFPFPHQVWNVGAKASYNSIYNLFNHAPDKPKGRHHWLMNDFWTCVTHLTSTVGSFYLFKHFFSSLSSTFWCINLRCLVLFIGMIELNHSNVKNCKSVALYHYVSHWRWPSTEPFTIFLHFLLIFYFFLLVAVPVGWCCYPFCFFLSVSLWYRFSYFSLELQDGFLFLGGLRLAVDVAVKTRLVQHCIFPRPNTLVLSFLLQNNLKLL